MKKLYALGGKLIARSGFFFRKKVNSIKKIIVTVKKAGRVKKPKLGVIAKKINSNKSDLIAIFVILVLYILLFLFLKNKILFTPDFGESDAYHLNLSLKYYLSGELKQNRIPFWTNALEGGYPLFSEAQIGGLFFPNIFFLKFFNFVDGYNLLFISSLFLLTFGFYILLRELGIHAIISLFFGFIFAFNGAISLRWVHLNLLQSFSLLPFLFYIAIKICKTNTFKYYLCFILVLSQMIFAGHMQTVFIGLIGLFLWSSCYIYIASKKNRERIAYIAKLTVLVIGGFIGSLPQILPNYVLSQYSNRSIALDYNNATSFPFSWPNLISFIKPYVFGNPKLGTYPPFSSDWGIFWENTPYVGTVFFIVLAILLFLNRKKLSLLAKAAFLLVIFFILLALGKNSPLYFVFNFPPFNFFRTPSKFLLMTSFFLMLSAALVANQWYKNTRFQSLKLVLIFVSIYIIYDLVAFSLNYHLFIPARNALQPPSSSQYIDSPSRYITFGQGQKWNEIFLKSGWNNETDIRSYLFMRNFLYPDSNLIFDRQIYNLNTGTFHLRRPVYVKNLIQEGSFDTSEINLMQILGIKTILSGDQIESQNITLIKKLTDKGINVYVYEIQEIEDEMYYIPKTIKRIEYLNEFEESFKNGTLSVENSLAENVPFKILENTGNYSLTPIKQTDYYSIFSGDFSDQTFLVLRQNIYPEWQITIDGKKTSMYPVNLVHMGIIVPKGKHTIVLKYNNTYFIAGSIIVIIFLLGFISIGIYRSKRA